LLCFAKQTMSSEVYNLGAFGDDEQAAFKKMFDLYYRPLTVFAMNYVNDINTARDIVQNVFVRLWEVRDSLSINRSVRAYLYQSVKNACINYSRSSYRLTEIHGDIPLQVLEDDVLERMIATETLESVYKAIETLPGRCREIFTLSRIKQLKHAEIAEKLNISPKTVENQISIALKKLTALLGLFSGSPLLMPFII